MAAADPPRDIGETLPPLSRTDQAAYDLGIEIRGVASTAAPGWLDHAVDVALNHPHPFPRGEARIALQLAPQDEAIAALLPPLASPKPSAPTPCDDPAAEARAARVERPDGRLATDGEARRQASGLRRAGRDRGGGAPPAGEARHRFGRAARAPRDSRARATRPAQSKACARAPAHVRAAAVWAPPADAAARRSASLLRRGGLQHLIRHQSGRSRSLGGSGGRRSRLDRGARLLLPPVDQGHGLVDPDGADRDGGCLRRTGTGGGLPDRRLAAGAGARPRSTEPRGRNGR